MMTQKMHPMRKLTTANPAVSSAMFARAVQNAVSVLSAANVQNAVIARQTTGMQIAARAVITATTLMMPPPASTLPYCRPQLQFRPVKMMPPKSPHASRAHAVPKPLVMKRLPPPPSD
jgi:hypothetical protein